MREGKIRVKRFRRVHEVIPDPTRCFLEQGLICAGPATHAGCGALCINANMPCRGCYGPPDGVADQGAALLGAVVSGFDGQSDAEIRQVLATIVDPVGTFYRFSLALRCCTGWGRTRMPWSTAARTRHGGAQPKESAR